MIKIKPIDNQTITEFFLSDPALCLLSLRDKDLHDLYYKKQFFPAKESQFVGIYKKGELVALSRIDPFLDLAFVFHMYVLTKYQHTGLAREVRDLMYQYYLDTTTATKAIVLAPDNCPHVKATAEGFGCKLEGRITKAFEWRGEVVDLLIYALELKRGLKSSLRGGLSSSVKEGEQSPKEIICH